jgi:tetratricopeptide (TPR) repeat protein
LEREKVKAYLPPIFVFAVTFAAYFYTLCPTVFWDDAGELIAACYTLGVPHPPGHPLYTILGKLFTLIPFGSPAMRVNLMSAVFGSLTCAVMFQVVRELIEHDEDIRRFSLFGGVIAALSAGFTLIMWNQSVLAETTTLHSFFMLLVTLIAFRIDTSDPDDRHMTRRLLTFSFIYGLSFTNHVAGLFFMPSLCLILLYRLRSRLFRPARFIAMIMLFFLGFIVYAYLPIASRFNPPVDWGNPENLKNFWWVISAKQYAGSLTRTPDMFGVLRGGRNVLETFVANLGILGCAFTALGCVRLWKKRKQVVVYGVLIILILYATSLNTAFIFVYMLPAVLMLAIWAGYGVAEMCERAEQAAARLEEGVLARIVGRSAYVVGTVLVLVLFFGHFGECNMRNYTYARDYGIELLGSLPEDAVLVTGAADPLFISWYLQYCEDYRTDVKVITRNGLQRPGYMDKIRRQYPEVQIPSDFQLADDPGIRPSHLLGGGKEFPWYANSYFKEFHKLNLSSFPIFWEGIEVNQLLLDRFEPSGLVFRIGPSEDHVDCAGSQVPNAADLVARIERDPAAGKIYGNHFFNVGIFYHWHNDTPQALGYYEDALQLYPDDERPLNNIGAILAAEGKVDEAFSKVEAALRLNPYNPSSNRNAALVLMDRGKAREAIPLFRRAIAGSPGNFEDYYSLGICYSSIGKNRKAVTMLRKALEIQPDSPVALSSLGVIYLRLKETQNAEKLLKTAVEIEPDNAENWYNLACLHAMENNEFAAIQSLAKALTYDSNRVYELGAKDPRISTILESLTKSR